MGLLRLKELISKQDFAIHYIINGTPGALLVSFAYFENPGTRGRNSRVKYRRRFYPQKHYTCIELVGRNGSEMEITYGGFSLIEITCALTKAEH